MPNEGRIRQMLQVPAAEHGPDWLKAALQEAIQLEFATIPPYLCAMWSVKDDEAPAYVHLREVVMEEMLHAALACNMLTAIGGTPDILPAAAAAYPGPLPGGVRPGLVVPLRRLTPEGIKDVFMEIEKPLHDIDGTDPADGANGTGATIGEFYDAIRAAFLALPGGVITGERQVARSIDINPDAAFELFKVQSVDDAVRAIDVIKEQGEGSSTSPLDTAKGVVGDLAHYYRFAELHHGRRLVLGPDGGISYTGDEIPFPETWPMADVPAGGYRAEDVPADVAELLADFDRTYTKVLDRLQAAWQSPPPQGGVGKLNGSVGPMHALTSIATELMQKEITPGGETYGPCFRIAE